MAVNSFNAQNPPLTTKGDLFTFSTIPTRLGVGSNDQVLIADSSTATGLKWGSASAADNFQLLNAGGTALTGANTITVSGISGKNSLLIRLDLASAASSAQAMRLRFNSDTGNKYGRIGICQSGTAIDSFSERFDSISYIQVGTMGGTATNYVEAFITVQGANSSGVKIANIAGWGSGSTNNNAPVAIGTYSGTSAISSVTIFTSGGANFDDGTIYIYGA